MSTWKFVPRTFDKPHISVSAIASCLRCQLTPTFVSETQQDLFQNDHALEVWIQSERKYPLRISYTYDLFLLFNFLSDVLSDFLTDLFVRFFCPIFSVRFLSPIFWPIYLSDFFVRFLCKIFWSDFCPFFLSDFLSNLLPIFYLIFWSDFFSVFFVRFLVRFFVQSFAHFLSDSFVRFFVLFFDPFFFLIFFLSDFSSNLLPNFYRIFLVRLFVWFFLSDFFWFFLSDFFCPIFVRFLTAFMPKKITHYRVHLMYKVKKKQTNKNKNIKKKNRPDIKAPKNPAFFNCENNLVYQNKIRLSKWTLNIGAFRGINVKIPTTEF